jgi:hypothetical protein
MDYEKLERHSSKCGRIKKEVRKEKPGDETVRNTKKNPEGRKQE